MDREFPQLMRPIPLEDDPVDTELDRLVEQGYLSHDDAARLQDPEEQRSLHEYFSSRGLLDDIVALIDDTQL